MKSKLFFVVISIVIGGMILVISLASSIRGGNVSPREYLDSGLLFHNKVIPGQVFYPFYVFRDKYQLFQANATEQFALRVEFGRMRLRYSQDLLDEEVNELSVSTLKKSQHYALSAEKYLTSDEDIQELAILIEEIQAFITTNKEKFNDEQKAFLDNMFTENHFFLEKLKAGK